MEEFLYSIDALARAITNEPPYTLRLVLSDRDRPETSDRFGYGWQWALFELGETGEHRLLPTLDEERGDCSLFIFLWTEDVHEKWRNGRVAQIVEYFVSTEAEAAAWALGLAQKELQRRERSVPKPGDDVTEVPF